MFGTIKIFETGLFNYFSYSYIDKLLENIETLNSEKEDLSTRLIECKSELNRNQKSYSDLQELYNDIENQYVLLNEAYYNLDHNYRMLLALEEQGDLLPVSNDIIVDKLWIDQIDIFY